MKLLKPATLITYLATIPFANWLISNVGSQQFPNGPHTIPVGFGYAAPSGVLAIGIALFARDFVQENYGRKITFVAIAIGVALSYTINPAVATASAIAFGISELADLTIYTTIRKRNIVAAVTISGIIGGIVDSLLFLQIAFDSTMFWQGQVIGKTYMAILGGILIWSGRGLSNRMFAGKTALA